MLLFGYDLIDHLKGGQIVDKHSILIPMHLHANPVWYAKGVIGHSRLDGESGPRLRQGLLEGPLVRSAGAQARAEFEQWRVGPPIFTHL